MSARQSLMFRWEFIFSALALGVMALCYLVMAKDTSGLLLNTLTLAAAVMAVALPLSATLAYCLTRCAVPLLWLWEAILLVLLFIPLFIQLASWEAGFGRGGWYSTLVAQQLTDPPLEGFRGAVWIHAMAAVPWLFWIFRLGLKSIPSTYEESARLDATPLQVFKHITLPLVVPTVVAAALYVLVVVSTEITVTDRYQYRSYAEVLYNEFVLNSRFDELPLTAAPVIVSMLGVCVAGLVLFRLIWPRMIHATTDRYVSAVSYNWLATLFVVVACGTLFVVPIGNLLYQAGIDVRVDGAGGRQRVWSLWKMLWLVGNSPMRYRNELAYTAVLSQMSVLASVAIATPLAWWVRSSGIRQFLAACIAIIWFATPGPFIGLGLIWMLNRDLPICGWLYDDTLFAPWFALTVRSFPFVYLVIWYGIRSIPKSVLEAGAVDGAGEIASLRYLALPLLVPSLVCAGLVGLAVSIGELSASVLVMPPGVTTVATEIFQLIHYGAEDQLAGLCLSCLLVMILIACLARISLRRLLAA